VVRTCSSPEVKGRTVAPGLDIGTKYGQILRRMRPDLGEQVRYGVVVHEPQAAAVQRVSGHVRRLLDIDVDLMSDLGRVRGLD